MLAADDKLAIFLLHELHDDSASNSTARAAIVEVVCGVPAIGDGEVDDFQEGPSFMCSDAAFAFPFREIVDLGWSNIEKVWLDGNFLTGEIPEDLARAWPRLQSLDLYDNNLEGTIPESLAELDLVKLQLQGNNFTGELPAGLTAMLASKGMVLGLAGNSGLHGCLPRGVGGLAETGLQHCEAGEL